MYPVKLTFEKKTIVILQTHGDIKGSVVLSIVTRNKTQRKDTTFLNSFFLKVNAVPLFLPWAQKVYIFVSWARFLSSKIFWEQTSGAIGIRLKPGLAEILYIIPWSKKVKIGVTLADVFSLGCVCAAILYFRIKRELTGIQIVKYICHVTWEKHFPFRFFYYRTKEETPSAYPYIRTCGNYRISYSVFSTSKNISLKYILHQTVIISALKITIIR